MTVSVPSNLVRSYAGDGSTVNFSYPIRFDADNELVVALRDADDVETVQTLGADYTVSGAGTASGTVTFLAAPASGVTVIIYRATKETQPVDLEDAARNPAEAVELQMDRTVRMIQDHKALLSRSVMMRPGSEGIIFPEPGSDDEYIGWLGGDLANKKLVATDETFPAVANTVPVRNAGNTAYEAKPVGATGLAVLEAGTQEDARNALGVNDFPTRAAAIASSLAVAPDYIRLAGYATAGDGRGFLAVKTASDPGHDAAFKITLADGITEQWYVAEDVKKKVAYILFTGQSNAGQPFANGSPADQIHPQAKIWDGSGWSTIGPNVGSPRPMASDATTHSLYNFTRRLIEEGGFVECRVIWVAYGGRPISDWVGTPANRTIDATNTPRMQEIKDAFNASGADKFTHVVMVQGEANSGDLMFPFSQPGTYGYEREFFRQSLVDQGMADDESTRWLEVELLRREVASTSWRANRAITQLDQTGRANVAVVSSAGFVGEDEGLTVTLLGTPIPYTLHFKSEENSELGNRLYEAARKLDTDAPADVQMGQQETLTPLGAPGILSPFYEILTGGTYSLSSQWARGSIISLIAGQTYNITLLADDLRTGYAAAAGKTIRFQIQNGTVLNLSTELFEMHDRTGGNRPQSASITRTGSALSSEMLELVFTGLRWEIVRDLTNYAAASGVRWRLVEGLLEAAGVHSVGLNAGDFTDVTFPAAMPALKNNGYQVNAESCCITINKTATGFRLHRQVSVGSGANVNWSLKFGELSAL